MSRRIKTLLGAMAASACLSACVGTDPQASLPSGGGVALTAFSAPMPATPQRVSAAMPGDPLFDTERAERGGVNPIAVLNRPPTRTVASASGSTTRSAVSNPATLAARLEESPKHLPQGMATLSAGPSPGAARTASADDDMTATMPAASVTSTLIPLSEVEARAAVEQRAQTLRDKRFDMQVRHASSIVCSGCVSAPGHRRGPTQVDKPEE